MYGRSVGRWAQLVTSVWQRVVPAPSPSGMEPDQAGRRARPWHLGPAARVLLSGSYCPYQSCIHWQPVSGNALVPAVHTYNTTLVTIHARTKSNLVDQPMHTTAMLPSTAKTRLASQGPADRPQGAQPGSYAAIQTTKLYLLAACVCWYSAYWDLAREKQRAVHLDPSHMYRVQCYKPAPFTHAPTVYRARPPTHQAQQSSL